MAPYEVCIKNRKQQIILLQAEELETIADLKKKIQEKIAERNALRDEFFAEKRKFSEYLAEQRRVKQQRYEEERKIQQNEWKIRQMEKEVEKIKRRWRIISQTWLAVR